jgi:hypothetical protein
MDEKKEFVKKFWQKRGREITHPRVATHFRIDDAIDYDFNLVKRFCNGNTKILDLGDGKCVLSSRLAPYVKEIVAVDFVGNFLKKGKLLPNIKTVASDIRTFESKEKYEIILLFGVLNYFFNNKELLSLYKRYKKMLAGNGVCIIKHQVGIKGTVIVDGYSEDVKGHYLAVYRQIEKEISLLKLVFNVVDVIDIYPPRLNRWANTHFYAFICVP